MQTDRARSDPRDALLKLIEERGLGLGPLSKAIGRNHAYLHQWISRRSPLVLPDAVREALGRYLKVDPDLFKSLDQPLSTPIDDQLLARANGAARFIVGQRPQDEPIRAIVAAAYYTLLERNAINDDEGTLQVLALLARRIRELPKPTPVKI